MLNDSVDLILSYGMIKLRAVIKTIYNQVIIFFGRILITKKLLNYEIIILPIECYRRSDFIKWNSKITYRY